jgi:nodulation protein E
MPDRRVVVTGLGVVSAIGSDVESFWSSLSSGRSGVRPIQSVDAGLLRFKNGAEVTGFDPADHFEPKQIAYIDRFAQFALVAAREAVRDSGLDLSELDRTRVAVITGSSAGGQDAMDEAFVELYRKQLPRVNPMMIPRVMSNSAASHICIEFGLHGPAFSVSTACSSANHAIGQALWLLTAGMCDIAITGGCESVFSFGFLKAWEAMRVISPDTCRPFSKDRSGLILGEGAGMFVLETAESASARGAPMYAEIAGFGMSADAHHITQPSADGAALAIRAALTNAAVAAEAIGYINAHGTATQANDPTETSAIRSVFGAHADRLAVSSTKSMHGHALGAAGALEGVATVLALKRRRLPPTVNFTESDPACDLDIIPNHARDTEVEFALSNSFAFGGLNAVLAFRAV